MSVKKKVLATLAILATLTACGSSNTAHAEEPANTDPRVGWVIVQPGNGGMSSGADDMKVAKVCDGTTLVYTSSAYYKGGIAVIPNSPECAPR